MDTQGLKAVSPLIAAIEASTSIAQLGEALAHATREMGFDSYALTHHVDMRRTRWQAIRLHDYPLDWADYYDRHGFGVRDPVHRASHLTTVGFAWPRLGEFLVLSEEDETFLERARGEGIGTGFTVPAHIPGEAHGSVSFVNAVGKPLPHAALPLAQLVGTYAFEQARRLWRLREPAHRAGNDNAARTLPRLTPRERECLVLVARGKSNWEIGRILGISDQTAALHVRNACRRYHVHKRSFLAIRALFDGSLSFTEILRP